MIWRCTSKRIPIDNNIIIMGIVNVTPDSFSDGGKYFDPDTAVKHALSLYEQGADIVDLGAQSTRPEYEEISAEEEWNRLKNVLIPLRKATNLPISIDTYFTYVAEKSLEEGADIINDVSGSPNMKMLETVKKYNAGWIIMHNGSATPVEVRDFFNKSLKFCEKHGLQKDRLCFDMGIGFGKTYEEDLALLANVSKYKIKNVPLMLGTSRKRVIGKSSAQPVAEKRVYGNIAADTAAVLGGVDIIRVHDVKNEKQGIKTANEIRKRKINDGQNFCFGI